MAILITGAGMVGAQIASRLLKMGKKPVLYDAAPSMDFLATVFDVSKVKVIRGDILDLPHLMLLIKEEKIDRIIHTAGLLLSGVRARPYAGLKYNIEGTLNILEASKLMGIKRVVFSSSVTVSYGIFNIPATAPFDEDFPMTCLGGRPKDLYPVSKLTGEYMGLCYQQLFGVDFVAVRFAGVFGPWIGTASGVPGMFIDQFAKKAAFGKQIVVDNPLLTYSGGEDFVYSKDAANSMVLGCFAQKRKLKTRIYNIAMGKLYQFQDVVDIVKKVFPKVRIQIKTISSSAIAGLPYPREYPFDISRAQKELGYEPEYKMEKALRDYSIWLKKYLAKKANPNESKR